MPRRARNIISKRMYHVMVQGINKEYIFNNNNFKNHYIYLLRNKLGDFNSIVIAYCIMDNHAHLLLYAENEKEISKLLQRLNCAYSNYYNKVKKRVGYVFRDRFLSQEINDINGIVNCIKYIHNNPVKAKMVNSVEKYYFSSYNEYITGSSHIIDFCLVNSVLNQVKNKEVIFEKDSFDDKRFLDISNYDRDFFYNKYVPRLDMAELKQNKKKLKEEICKCRIEMEVPFKDLSMAFGISDKMIYRWMKDEKREPSPFLKINS